MIQKPALIVSAGMPRSASTWLYNVARLILESDPEIKKDLTSGWIEDLKRIPSTPIILVKTHEYVPDLAEKAQFILYSYRDIRDVIASLYRKFNVSPTVEGAAANIAQYEKWRMCADFVMKYEDMKRSPESVVKNLAEKLGYPNINPSFIISKLNEMSYETEGKKNSAYHLSNLYHKGHITDGRHGSWESTLDQGLIEQLELNFRDWLETNGYPLTKIL